MSEKEPTPKPTLDTILEMLRGIRQTMDSRFDALDVRLDRIESDVKKTQSDFHALRADFLEFRREVRDHFPAVQ